MSVVGLFVAARYLLATYENELLLRERERQRQAAEQLYLQVNAANQRLQEVDQLKDQFMMIASHELRTPLICVKGYLELLTEFRDLLPPERHQDILQKAERSCNELAILLIVRLESDMNSSIRGSGLGLYISRRLIEGMAGKIWLESSGIPGEGTTVHIQLPRSSSIP